MTAHWTHLPYDFLDLESRRIANEMQGISRVVYDISGKPPAMLVATQPPAILNLAFPVKSWPLLKLAYRLTEDIELTLPAVWYGELDAVEGFNVIWARLVTKLKGQSWKSSDAVAESHMKRFPELLNNEWK